MFLETIEKDGLEIPRFSLVTNAELIKELAEARVRRYGAG